MSKRLEEPCIPRRTHLTLISGILFCLQIHGKLPPAMREAPQTGNYGAHPVAPPALVPQEPLPPAGEHDDVEIEKSNVLILGPTGESDTVDGSFHPDCVSASPLPGMLRGSCRCPSHPIAALMPALLGCRVREDAACQDAGPAGECSLRHGGCHHPDAGRVRGRRRGKRPVQTVPGEL